MSHGILVCGLNGAGKTTLARELALLLGYKHMDIEDYYFLPSEIPYTRSRTQEECIPLMLADMDKHTNFVLSAVIGDFGNEIIKRFDLAVIIDAPLDVRMARVLKRDIDRFGNRVLEGGDLYEQQMRFRNKVAARPADYAEQWAKTLACPVLRIDGTRDYHDTAREIAEYLKGGNVLMKAESNTITIKPLTPDMAEDYMDFFINRAYTDHPDWAGCCCMHFHACKEIDDDYEVVSKNENHDDLEFVRSWAKKYVLEGKLQGYLAYSDGVPVGWCNANDKGNFTALRHNVKPELWEEPTGKAKSVVCFCIAPDYRSQGIASRLLERVCADAEAQGYEYVEAYPQVGSSDIYVNHHGSDGLYLRQGFVLHKQADGQDVVRKYFTDDAYNQCPTFENEQFLLRLVEPGDAEDLLAVYADPKAQDILTDCSAWNCDFGYGAKGLTAMQDCIGKWIASYKNRSFVRMTIFDKQSQRAVGTIEAYRRAEGSFCGGKICLRLDLHSDYENEKAIDELLSLIVKDGIKTFGADGIVTRATPITAERIKALVKNGFILSDETLHDDHGWGVTYGDFWVKTV
jgi:adenylate kinase family enzyme/GNAT superfamily N-acetyltransferase